MRPRIRRSSSATVSPQPLGLRPRRAGAASRSGHVGDRMGAAAASAAVGAAVALVGLGAATSAATAGPGAAPRRPRAGRRGCRGAYGIGQLDRRRPRRGRRRSRRTPSVSVPAPFVDDTHRGPRLLRRGDGEHATDRRTCRREHDDVARLQAAERRATRSIVPVRGDRVAASLGRAPARRGTRRRRPARTRPRRAAVRARSRVRSSRASRRTTSRSAWYCANDRFSRWWASSRS